MEVRRRSAMRDLSPKAATGQQETFPARSNQLIQCVEFEMVVTCCTACDSALRMRPNFRVPVDKSFEDELNGHARFHRSETSAVHKIMLFAGMTVARYVKVAHDVFNTCLA